ncbi:MAG: phosphotransferase [Gammaproteobacteria bacterium]|nr:phosphotransferase [Gammaproteobacteria bacterium]
MTIEVVGSGIESNEFSSGVQEIADAVARAVEDFGFRSGELRLVSHYVNTVFRLTTDAGRYVVRAHRAANRTASEIASELAWLDSLSLEQDISVPRVHKTLDGEAIAIAPVTDEETELPISILGWVSGRTIGDEKHPRDFRELGRMIASLHRHAQIWSPSASFDRPTYDSKSIFRLDFQVRMAKILGFNDARPIIEALSTLRQRLESVESELGSTSDVFGLVHGDLSFGNVLFGNSGAIPIDFDDCGFGYYLHDFSVPLAGGWVKPGFDERYQAFVTGYRQRHELPRDLLQHVPVFLGLRSAQLIMDYLGQVPWKQGIFDQYRTRLLPALEACDVSSDWIR